MKNLAALFCLAFSLHCAAQITGISVETVMEHDGLAIPELAGHTTYRVYADVTSSTDFISAVYGRQDSPLMLGTDGAFFHDATAGNFAQNVVPSLFSFFPTLEYDSWLTIGISNSDEGSSVQNTPSTLVDAFAAFNAGDGFVVNDPIGGSWFNLLQCLSTLEECAMEDLAFGGEDNRVLLAQLTSTGDVYGVFNMQVLPAGDQDEPILQTLTFSSNGADLFGCTNPAATGNEEGEGMYDPAATIDDFSCALPCTVDLSLANVMSPTCNGNADAGIAVEAMGAQGADYFYLDSIGSQQGLNFGNFGNLLAGTYMVYVQDGVGCVDSLQVHIPEGPDVDLDSDYDGVPDCDEIEGCWDILACNYDPAATDDDGSCEFTSCAGCTDASACNYDSSATIDDDSCDIPDADCEECVDGAPMEIDTDGDGVGNCDEVGGCTDPGACNYLVNATDDDNSCTYADSACEECGLDGIVVVNDEDEDGICDSDEILGCVDDVACNYSESATDDDESCEYDSCYGCTNELACNYDSAASFQDDSCLFAEQFYDCDGDCINDLDGDGVCDEIGTCLDPSACVDCNGESLVLTTSISVDMQCIDVGDNRVMLYTNLPPSHNTFEMSDEDGDGIYEVVFDICENALIPGEDFNVSDFEYWYEVATLPEGYTDYSDYENSLGECNPEPWWQATCEWGFGGLVQLRNGFLGAEIEDTFGGTEQGCAEYWSNVRRVTFRVDVSEQDFGDSAMLGVYAYGDTEWVGVLTDDDADGVAETDIYIRDQHSSSGDPSFGYAYYWESCEFSGEANLTPFGNHQLLPLICWGACGPCEGSNTLTLSVDQVVHASCNGNANCDGGVAFSIEGGLPPYQVAMDDVVFGPPTTGDFITGICEGWHKLQVQDSEGVYIEQSFLVGAPNSLDLIVHVDDATCQESSDGELYVWANGPEPSQWTMSVSDSTGQILETTSLLLLEEVWGYALQDAQIHLQGLNPGTYVAAMENNSGCFYFEHIEVGVDEDLDIATQSSPASCEDCADGSAVIGVINGEPSSFGWNDPLGQTTPTATGLLPGFYEGSVISENGCLVTEGVEVGYLSDTPDNEGQCGPGTYWNPEEQQCLVVLPADIDVSGCVGMSDLLELLALFGMCIEG